ncbi:MAG: type II toxin-antitoxin system VapC family toxin [Acidimicrobiia bacterium]|nr:type II toxin-antitoxin system VapC family toxin [Acidimicrobiia bacterium]
MVIDTSALLAILGKEPERDRLAAAIASDPARLVSAATVLETAIVIESKYGVTGAMDFDLLLHTIQAQIEPVGKEHARIGRLAYRQYGKGRHPAGLNYGDCFSYALAKISGQPLLFKGSDFSQTDLPQVSY